MGDPYNGFEGRIRIVDLIHKRILYHRGQRGVKSGCRFLQIPELDIYKNLRWGRKARRYGEKKKIRTIKHQDLSAVVPVRNRKR